MMTCEEITDFLDSYMDGELPPDVAQTFEKHLEMCPPCVVFLDTYKATVHLGRACVPKADEEREAPPEGLIRAILKARKTEAP